MMNVDEISRIRNAGITSTAQLGTLVALTESEEPMSLGQVAATIGITQAGMTQICDSLAKIDLVMRIRGADRRRIVMELTNKGKAVLGERV